MALQLIQLNFQGHDGKPAGTRLQNFLRCAEALYLRNNRLYLTEGIVRVDVGVVQKLHAGFLDGCAPWSYFRQARLADTQLCLWTIGVPQEF